jgi:hypothetical protein
MNQKAEDGDQIEVDNVEVIEDEESQDAQVNDEQSSDTIEADESEGSEDAGDEVVVSIGEEAPPPEDKTHAPEWVRELRKANREKERRIKELEAKLNSSATENKPVALGAKPKLEDHDYDSDRYEAALEQWYDRKRQVEAQAEQTRQAEQAQRDAWQAKLDAYGKARAELKVRDFEDAEATAQELFDVTQQGIVVQGADNPALVIYALGKNPKKAQEIASIKDPVKFAFAVAKLEKELKVTNRKAAPPPERTIQGTGRVSGSVDSTLERLRAEALKTGDMTKVVAYKRQKRA